jgi:prolipoprotein diacylglyceryltransferase
VIRTDRRVGALRSARLTGANREGRRPVDCGVVLPLVPAVIAFHFDPILSIGGINVRWETIGVAVAAFAAIVVAGLIARATPIDLSRPADAPGEEPGELNHLRRDDLLYITVAALPGAVVGGRLGYALLHLDYYQANPSALLAVGQGGFELALAVVGGFVTGAIVAILLGAPVGRWMHALVLPVLLAIAGGKAAMVLGGTGQGLPVDLSWATAYLGAGPWGSLAPEMPSHPAQAYEAIATAVVIVVVMWFVELGSFPGRNGGAFLLGIGLWATARAVVAITWRDRAVAGPLGMDQVICVALAVSCFVLLVLVGSAAKVRGGRPRSEAEVAPGELPATMTPTPAAPVDPSAPDWPDPEARPRI